ncbi:MAG: hypothetical protein L6R45_27345 [Anaerolineae bacterium]|nr:hypothetical protein [Anaerolineae bacterium]
MPKRYNLGKIRRLLAEGFDDADLRNFCFDTPDFRPVYHELSQATGKREIISHLLEYADQQSKIDILLSWAKEHNPAKYEQHQPYYFPTGPLSDFPAPKNEPVSFKRVTPYALLGGVISLIVISFIFNISPFPSFSTATITDQLTTEIDNQDAVSSPEPTTIPTVVKLQEILSFRDDFSSNGHSWDVEPFDDDLASGQLQIIGGTYHWTIISKQNDIFYSEPIPNFSTKDFWLEFDATLDAPSNDAGIAILFRLQDDNNYYRVNFDNQGAYNVQIRQNGKIIDLEFSTVSDNIKLNLKLVNRLAIRVVDSNFTLYANDRELATVTDSTFTEAGEIYLVVYQPANQTTVADFDNLMITELVPDDKVPEIRTTATARVVAPTATAAARRTAMANAVVVVDEDFGSNMRGWQTKPRSGQKGDYYYEFTDDGQYRLTIKSKQGTGSWVQVPGLSLRDFRLRFEATISEAPDNYGEVNISIAFRENEANDLYQLDFEENTYALWLKQDENFEKKKSFTSDAFKLDQGITNTFEILVTDTNFTIYANSQELATISDPTLNEPGSIWLGIGLDSGEEVLKVDFDNLVIEELPLARPKSEIETAVTATANAMTLARLAPTATAIAQATAIANATILFEEDFSSNVQGWDAEFHDDEYSISEAQIDGGKLRWRVESKQAVTKHVTVPTKPAKDFYLQFEATIVEIASQGDDIGIGLQFRRNDGNYYHLLFKEEGMYRLDARKDGQWIKPRPQADTFSKFINLKPGETNTFALLAKDSKFTIYANGQELITTKPDITLTETGEIALAVSLFEADQTLIVEFDNLVIKETP